MKSRLSPTTPKQSADELVTCSLTTLEDRLNNVLKRINALFKTESGQAPGAATETGASENEAARMHRVLDQLETRISEQHRTVRTLNEVERFNASILACIPQAIIATGLDGLVTVFSSGAESMLGYPATEIIGRQTPLLFLDREEVRQRAAELSKEMGFEFEPDFDVLVAKTKRATKSDEREWTYICKDGTRIKVLLEATPLLDAQGAIGGLLCVATDITERSLAAAEVEQLAYYDHLTRLPNRRLFHDRMQVAIMHARRDDVRLALMMIDLDKFKPVNDNLGHAVGDLLLKVVTQRMQACLRDSDTLARLGGDEFVVILPVVVSGEDALLVAEKIRIALNEPFELPGGYTVSIACSIGIVIFPDHGTDEKRLLKNADDAMYIAKEGGRNCVRLFKALADEGSHDSGGLPIMHLVWRNAYRCGVTSIDEEHKELFVRANKLIQSAMHGEDDPEQVPLLLDELIDSVGSHFASEEAVLRQYHYPDIEDHMLKHQRLVGRALELRSMAEDGELTLGDLVTFLAQEVVAKHLLKEDSKFFPLLKEAMRSERLEATNTPGTLEGTT